MFASMFELFQSAVSFVTTTAAELLSILSLTKQLADLVSHFLGLLGF